MKAKATALLFIIAIIVIPVLDSCKKYPDGPPFSLRTRTERVANTWKVENYRIDGEDFTSLLTEYSETFTKKGGYAYSWGNIYESGTWSFQNKDKEIKLNGEGYQSSRTLFILKLEEKSFWYYYMDGTDKYELHLIAN